MLACRAHSAGEHWATTPHPRMPATRSCADERRRDRCNSGRQRKQKIGACLLEDVGVLLVVALGELLEAPRDVRLGLLGQQAGRARPPAELEELVLGHPVIGAHPPKGQWQRPGYCCRLLSALTPSMGMTTPVTLSPHGQPRKAASAINMCPGLESCGCHEQAASVDPARGIAIKVALATPRTTMQHTTNGEYF